MDEKYLEERLEKVVEMLDSAGGFLDNLDIEVPEQAKKVVISILKSEEIKSIVEDIKNRRPPRIVIMGRSGVGKSSLINAMFGAYLAETSAVEVGTVDQEIFRYKKNEKVIFEIIDTRGLKENIKELTHSAETDLNDVIETFQPDAFLFLTSGADRSGLKKDAEDLNKIFAAMSVKPPLITVITRIDQLEPSRIKDASEYSDRKKENIKQKEQQVKRVLNNAGIANSFTVPVSSYIEWNHEDPEGLSVSEREHLTIEFDGRYNIDTLMDTLEENIDFNVALDLMFNHKIDRAIEKIADIFVKRFSAASGLVGASPIPVADIIILLPIQIVEVTLIAYLSGNQIDGKTAREFIVSLGAVFLFGFGLRFAVQQGSKFLNVIPGAGSAISGTVAYSGTYSIGKAAIAYYVKGMSLDESKKEAEVAKEELEVIEEPSKEVVEAEQKIQEAVAVDDNIVATKEEVINEENIARKEEKDDIKTKRDIVKENWDKFKTKLPWQKK